MNAPRDVRGKAHEESNIDIEISNTTDIEKNEPQASLERQVSGPLYSVFSKGMKIWTICLVSVSALISPFGATTFLPALNVMSDVLHVTPTQVNISITTYMVRCYYRPLTISASKLIELD